MELHKILLTFLLFLIPNYTQAQPLWCSPHYISRVLQKFSGNDLYKKGYETYLKPILGISFKKSTDSDETFSDHQLWLPHDKVSYFDYFRLGFKKVYRKYKIKSLNSGIQIGISEINGKKTIEFYYPETLTGQFHIPDFYYHLEESSELAQSFFNEDASNNLHTRVIFLDFLVKEVYPQLEKHISSSIEKQNSMLNVKLPFIQEGIELESLERTVKVANTGEVRITTHFSGKYHITTSRSYEFDADIISHFSEVNPQDELKISIDFQNLTEALKNELKNTSENRTAAEEFFNSVLNMENTGANKKRFEIKDRLKTIQNFSIPEQAKILLEKIKSFL